MCAALLAVRCLIVVRRLTIPGCGLMFTACCLSLFVRCSMAAVSCLLRVDCCVMFVVLVVRMLVDG